MTIRRPLSAICIAAVTIWAPVTALANLFVQINVNDGSVAIINDDAANATYLGQYNLTSPTTNTWDPSRWNPIGMENSSGNSMTLQEAQSTADAVPIGPGATVDLGTPYQWTSLSPDNPPAVTFTYSVSDSPGGGLTTDNGIVQFVPEPASLALLGIITLGVTASRRRNT